MSLLKSLIKAGVTAQGQNLPESSSKPVEPQNIDSPLQSITFDALQVGMAVRHDSGIEFVIARRSKSKKTGMPILFNADGKAFPYLECSRVNTWQDSDYQDLADSLALIADRTFMNDADAKSCLECFQQSYDRLNLIAAWKLLSTSQQAIIKALMDVIKAEQAEKSKLELLTIKAGDRVFIIGALFNEHVLALRSAVPATHKYRSNEQSKIEAYWLKDWDWMGIHQVRSVDGDLVALANGRKLPVNCLQKYVQ